MKQPSQCDRVLEVLNDGQWHTIQEIHERAGTMRLNSRISELRERRDLIIECDRTNGTYRYKLLGSLSEGDAGEGNDHEALASVALTADDATSPSLSEPEQPVLFEDLSWA